MLRQNLTELLCNKDMSVYCKLCLFKLNEHEMDLKTNNVEFKLDIFQSPICRIAVIVDSEGNAITLHQLKGKA